MGSELFNHVKKLLECIEMRLIRVNINWNRIEDIEDVLKHISVHRFINIEAKMLATIINNAISNLEKRDDFDYDHIPILVLHQKIMSCSNHIDILRAATRFNLKKLNDINDEITTFDEFQQRLVSSGNQSDWRFIDDEITTVDDTNDLDTWDMHWDVKIDNNLY